EVVAGSATVEAPQPVKAGGNRRVLVFLVAGVALVLALFVGKTVMGGGGSSNAPSTSAPATPAAAAPAPGAPAPTTATTAPAVPPPPAGPVPNTTRDPFRPLK